jgi:hypothetical protein
MWFYLLQTGIFAIIVWGGIQDGLDPTVLIILGVTLAYVSTLLVVLLLEGIRLVLARGGATPHRRPAGAPALDGNSSQPRAYLEGSLRPHRLHGEALQEGPRLRIG